MPLDKIYQQQWVPFLALVLVVTHVRSSTLPHPFPGLNPISLFGTILHAPPSTSFTAFRAINVAGFAEHLRSVRNNDVDKCVARTIFFYLIPSWFLFLSSMGGQKRWLLTFSLHCLCSSTSHLFISRLCLVYWSTLKIANDLPIFVSYYALLCICYCFSHLIGLLSVTWFIQSSRLISWGKNNTWNKHCMKTPERFHAVFVK